MGVLSEVRQSNFFLPVRKSPTQIGFGDVETRCRNSHAWSPLNSSLCSAVNFTVHMFQTLWRAARSWNAETDSYLVPMCQRCVALPWGKITHSCLLVVFCQNFKVFRKNYKHTFLAFLCLNQSSWSSFKKNPCEVNKNRKCSQILRFPCYLEQLYFYNFCKHMWNFDTVPFKHLNVGLQQCH